MSAIRIKKPRRASPRTQETTPEKRSQEKSSAPQSPQTLYAFGLALKSIRRRRCSQEGTVKKQNPQSVSKGTVLFMRRHSVLEQQYKVRSAANSRFFTAYMSLYHNRNDPSYYTSQESFAFAGPRSTSQNIFLPLWRGTAELTATIRPFVPLHRPSAGTSVGPSPPQTVYRSAKSLNVSLGSTSGVLTPLQQDLFAKLTNVRRREELEEEKRKKAEERKGNRMYDKYQTAAPTRRLRPGQSYESVRMVRILKPSSMRIGSTAPRRTVKS